MSRRWGFPRGGGSGNVMVDSQIAREEEVNRPPWLAAELAAMDDAGLRRRVSSRSGPQGPTIALAGQTLVNFGSNDYLALAADRRLASAAIAAIDAEGVGSGASPLITGHSGLHARLEQRLAEFEGTEAALLFPSGFAANLAAVTALAGQGDVIFSDAKNHASIWDGCRLSRAERPRLPPRRLAATGHAARSGFPLPPPLDRHRQPVQHGR